MALSEEDKREQNNERQRRWRLAHLEVARERYRAWAGANREHKAEYMRAWYAANPDWAKEHPGKWWAEHREEKKAANLAHYYANKEKYLEQSRRWKLEHPERRKEITRDGARKRRAQKRGVECESVNAIEVFERDGWRCRMCGCETPRSWENRNIWSPELDHIVPLARGGSHTYANTQLLCHRCNARKAARLLPSPSRTAVKPTGTSLAPRQRKGRE